MGVSLLGSVVWRLLR